MQSLAKEIQVIQTNSKQKVESLNAEIDYILDSVHTADAARDAEHNYDTLRMQEIFKRDTKITNLKKEYANRAECDSNLDKCEIEPSATSTAVDRLPHSTNEIKNRIL